MEFENNETTVTSLIQESIRVKQGLLEDQTIRAIAEAARWACEALQAGGKILLMGNGGSAADAQHIAAELVGRFERQRRALPAIALTANTSTLTAIANDYDYTQLFSRQLEAWLAPLDLVIGISTSGNSANVIAAMECARRAGVKTVGLTGEDGGELAASVNLCIRVPSRNTARIQESHILIGHILCRIIDDQIDPPDLRSL
jgi:D-sedoheptulose 7-phosphate isomerase